MLRVVGASLPLCGVCDSFAFAVGIYTCSARRRAPQKSGLLPKTGFTLLSEEL